MNFEGFGRKESSSVLSYDPSSCMEWRVENLGQDSRSVAENRTCGLQIRSWNASHSVTLMMEAASTSETSVNFYQTTRRNNPEDSHLHSTGMSGQHFPRNGSAMKYQRSWLLPGLNSTPCEYWAAELINRNVSSRCCYWLLLSVVLSKRMDKKFTEFS
jgi:hypothetical protein